MKKFVSFVIIFLFAVSESGFSDDLINAYSPKKATSKPVSKKAPSTAVTPLDAESKQIIIIKPTALVPIQIQKEKPKEPKVESIAEKPEKIEKKIPAPSTTFDRVAAVKAAPTQRTVSVDMVQSGKSFMRSNLFGIGHDNLWRILPGFKFMSQYDSNINREPPHQRDEDIIFNYIPSVAVKRAGSRYDFRADYEMNFQEFLRNSDQNSFNHTATSKFIYHGNRLTVKLNEAFSYVRAYASSEQTERRTVLINDFSPEIIYRLTPKFSISAIYWSYLFSYKEIILKENNYISDNIGGRIYYHYSPKLDFYFEGAGFNTDYYNSGIYDSNGYTASLGTTGKLTRKILANIRTGFKSNRYDDSSINSYHDWILEGSLQYLLTRKVDISLIGKRDKQESIYRNAGWFQSNFIGLLGNYRITRLVTLTAESNIRSNAYPGEQTEGALTKKRKDWILETGLGAKWRPVQNLVLTVGYSLRERFSNFDNLFEYVAHIVDASVSYQFA